MSKFMACPRCGEPRNRTLDSRGNSLGVRRRRVCLNNHRFTTYELTENRMREIKTHLGAIQDALSI